MYWDYWFLCKDVAIIIFNINFFYKNSNYNICYNCFLPIVNCSYLEFVFLKWFKIYFFLKKNISFYFTFLNKSSEVLVKIRKLFFASWWMWHYFFVNFFIIILEGEILMLLYFYSRANIQWTKFIKQKFKLLFNLFFFVSSLKLEFKF